MTQMEMYVPVVLVENGEAGLVAQVGGAARLASSQAADTTASAGQAEAPQTSQNDVITGWAALIIGIGCLGYAAYKLVLYFVNRFCGRKS